MSERIPFWLTSRSALNLPCISLSCHPLALTTELAVDPLRGWYRPLNCGFREEGGPHSCAVPPGVEDGDEDAGLDMSK